MQNKPITHWVMATCIGAVLTGCSLISQAAVDYSGVRRDVAHWINDQPTLSLSQKRALASYSRTQQQIYRADSLSPQQQAELGKQSQLAYACASRHVSASKLKQLESQIFSTAEQQQQRTIFWQQQPKTSLSPNEIKAADCLGHS